MIKMIWWYTYFNKIITSVWGMHTYSTYTVQCTIVYCILRKITIILNYRLTMKEKRYQTEFSYGHRYDAIFWDVRVSVSNGPPGQPSIRRRCFLDICACEPIFRFQPNLQWRYDWSILVLGETYALSLYTYKIWPLVWSPEGPKNCKQLFTSAQM